MVLTDPARKDFVSGFENCYSSKENRESRSKISYFERVDKTVSRIHMILNRMYRLLNMYIEPHTSTIPCMCLRSSLS